jgi:FMN phosphatase YigB (HAD superfamily)
LTELTSRPVLLVDFGGVLVQGAERAALVEWQDRLGLGRQSVAAAIFQNRSSRLAMSGQVPAHELFTALGAQLELSPCETHELWETFWRSQVLNEPLFEYLRSSTHGADIAICSNFWPNYKDIMLERYRLDRLTRLFFVSCQLECMKPSPRFFARVKERCGSHRRFALVDDAVENVAGAERSAISGMHHLTTDRTIERIERWLAGPVRSSAHISACRAEP